MFRRWSTHLDADLPMLQTLGATQHEVARRVGREATSLIARRADATQASAAATAGPLKRRVLFVLHLRARGHGPRFCVHERKGRGLILALREEARRVDRTQAHFWPRVHCLPKSTLRSDDANTRTARRARVSLSVCVQQRSTGAHSHRTNGPRAQFKRVYARRHA